MIFFIGMGVGLFPHTNLCGSTNSVLARQKYYSQIKENIKRGLNYFDKFFLFFEDYLYKNIFI